MKSAVTIAAVIIAAMAASASAGVYRWVDQEGKVHYSDKPVNGAQQIEVKGPGIDSTSTNASTPSGEASEQPVEQPKEAVEVAAQQCEKARKRRETYENAGSLVQEDEYGRKKDVKGNDRVNLIMQAKKDEEQFCNEQAAAPKKAY